MQSKCLHFGHLITALGLLMSHSPAFGNEPDYSDRAAVSLETYDEKPPAVGRNAMAGDGVALEKLICGAGDGKGSFHVPVLNYFPLQFMENFRLATLIDLFETSLDYALDDIAKKPTPKLYVFMDGHGSPGNLCTQESAGKYSYKQLFEIILNKVAIFEKQTDHILHLEIFIDSCYSGSAIPIFEKIIDQKEKSSAHFDATLFTASDEDQEAKGRVLLDQISDLNSVGLPLEKWAEFAAAQNRESHLLWTNNKQVFEHFMNQLFLNSKFPFKNYAHLFRFASADLLLRKLESLRDVDERWEFLSSTSHLSSPQFRHEAALELFRERTANEINTVQLSQLLHQLIEYGDNLRADLQDVTALLTSRFLKGLLQVERDDLSRTFIYLSLEPLQKKDKTLREYLVSQLRKEPLAVRSKLYRAILPDEAALTLASDDLENKSLSAEDRELLLSQLNKSLARLPDTAVGARLRKTLESILRSQCEDGRQTNYAQLLLDRSH